MKTIIENLVLCADCVQPAVYDDYTALDYHYTADIADEKMKAIKDGLKKLGSGLRYDSSKEPDEFSCRPCDCCGTRLAGSRDYFIIFD